MPIDTVAKPVTYLCDGLQTAFPITFTYLENSFVWVRRTNGVTLGVETLSLGDDYTITADTVNTIATYPTGDKLTLSLLIPMKQLVDLEKNGRIDADVLDYVHDKLTLICQQLDMDVETLVGLEVPEDPAPSMKVPDATTRASKYLAFDAQGNIVVVSALDTGSISVSPWGETLIGLADSSAGRAQLDVYSEAEADAITDDLAGAGRTTETVKDNADGIADHETRIAAIEPSYEDAVFIEGDFATTGDIYDALVAHIPASTSFCVEGWAVDITSSERRFVHAGERTGAATAIELFYHDDSVTWFSKTFTLGSGNAGWNNVKIRLFNIRSYT